MYCSISIVVKNILWQSFKLTAVKLLLTHTLSLCPHIYVGPKVAPSFWVLEIPLPPTQENVSNISDSASTVQLQSKNKRKGKSRRWKEERWT